MKRLAKRGHQRLAVRTVAPNAPKTTPRTTSPVTGSGGFDTPRQRDSERRRATTHRIDVDDLAEPGAAGTRSRVRRRAATRSAACSCAGTSRFTTEESTRLLEGRESPLHQPDRQPAPVMKARRRVIRSIRSQSRPDRGCASRNVARLMPQTSGVSRRGLASTPRSPGLAVLAEALERDRRAERAAVAPVFLDRSGRGVRVS